MRISDWSSDVCSSDLVAAALTQALLHVGARGRGSGRGRGRSRVGSGGGVPREGEVEPMQLAGLQRPLPFELVQELAAEIPVAEEQPVAPTGTDGSALLHEAAERRHARSGPESGRASCRERVGQYV